MWDVVSATRRSSGVAPRACARVYARVLVPPNLYIHTHRLLLYNPRYRSSSRADAAATGRWQELLGVRVNS